MKIAILGYGRQGRSVYEYYRGSGNTITICDKNLLQDLPADVETELGSSYLNRLDRFDKIFRSPVVHPKDITDVNGMEILKKVTSNTNEFFKLCPTKNIIGVTGTKGKGTSSTLITEMMQAYGFRVHFGGNIGIPPLELLKDGIKEDDWVVLELANFQLIDLSSSPKIAVCLLVEPEHLDWHMDVDEYYRAKTELFRHQDEDGIAIYYAKNDNSKRIASTSPGTLIPYYQAPGALVAGSHITINGIPVIRLNELKLIGKHNWQNVCAAVTAVWQVKQDPEALASVLRDFNNLPFRIELRREVSGVSYYNDSFASDPVATVAAIETIASPKVLIVGGRDRNLDLSKLVNIIKSHAEDIRKILIIGESAKRLADELTNSGFSNFEVIASPTTMEAIVGKAAEVAEKGDSVVLSPSFPSFDMFKDFEDRGNQFNEAVAKL